MPPKRAAMNGDHLRLELAKHEAGLQEWIERCSVNAIWYMCDPVGALRSANLGIDESILKELESAAARGLPIGALRPRRPTP